MTRKLSRRAFIKTAGIGVAATAVLTGCGPASRYVLREPYTRMPEYTYNGQSTFTQRPAANVLQVAERSCEQNRGGHSRWKGILITQ
jgi:hypothetical protein